MYVVWRNMEVSEQLLNKIEPVLEQCEVKLYEIKWRSNDKTLEIAIMKEDGTMDLDTCAAVSEKISEVLDQDGSVSDAYMLEVCSPGAEREIKDLDELNHLKDPYIYVRLKHPFKKMLELTGAVTSFENGVITLDYRDKAAHRTAEIDAENIDYIRLAVKF